MGKATADSAAGQKMLPTDCISILLMALGSPSISKSTFEMMSALDGTRTASSFEHQFRPITAKAKEFKARVDAGETFSPVTPPRKRGVANMSPPATPKKRKVASEEDEGTPTRKPAKKHTPKPRAKKTVEVHDEDDDEEQPANDLNGEGFPLDADVFIKSEKNWEEGYA